MRGSAHVPGARRGPPRAGVGGKLRANACSYLIQWKSRILSEYSDVVKLSEWAARNGVHYQTAWTWAKEGRMPVPAVQTPSGTWLVTEPALPAAGRVAAYCRVSSGDQKADLERQVARVVQGATGQGLAIADVVSEVGSGVSGRRRKLHRLLADPRVGTIVVEHRDRLDRFGVEHLEAALSATGRRLVVLDPAEAADDPYMTSPRS